MKGPVNIQATALACTGRTALRERSLVGKRLSWNRGCEEANDWLLAMGTHGRSAED